MSRAKKVAFAGIMTALCVIFLFIGSLFQTLDLSAAAFAGVIITFTLTELGKGWSFGVYAAASILAIILLPYKTPAAVFALFCGFYPILKVYLNKIKPIWLSYAARLLCFNVCLAALMLLSKSFFTVDDELLELGLFIYPFASIVFLVYDFAMERLSVYYLKVIKPKLSGIR